MVALRGISHGMRAGRAGCAVSDQGGGRWRFLRSFAIVKIFNSHMHVQIGSQREDAWRGEAVSERTAALTRGFPFLTEDARRLIEVGNNLTIHEYRWD